MKTCATLSEAQREKGPVEILCKEIGFRFDRRMETTDVFVAFVSVLVSNVALMRAEQEHLAGIAGKPPSENSGEVLRRTLEMLASNDPDGLVGKAAEVHGFIHHVEPDDAYPCDHLIDMLSSCVSAIRFGLETPCRSRHAAEAAGHIWGRIYGVKRFDSFTPNWQREWTRAQLQEAILLRMTDKGCAALGSDPPAV